MFFKSYFWRTRLLNPSWALLPSKNHRPGSWFLFEFPLGLDLLEILMITHIDSMGCSTKPCHATGGNPNPQQLGAGWQHHVLFPFPLWVAQHMPFPDCLLLRRQPRRTGRWHPPPAERRWLVSCWGLPFETLSLHLVACRILTVKITTPWNSPSFSFHYLL